MDDELFRGGGLRNEPAMLERVGEGWREDSNEREREREISFPLSLSLHLEDGNPCKKLAPNCTNMCHRKFAEIKYRCGRSDRAA